MSGPKQLLEAAKHGPGDGGALIDDRDPAIRRGALQMAATAFVFLFCIVGLALWGLPGRLRDATGNYSESCFLLVGVALLGALAVLGLPDRRKSA